MKQEIQVKLTLEVDSDINKDGIQSFMAELINTHAMHSSAFNRMVFSSIKISEILEEANTPKPIQELFRWSSTTEFPTIVHCIDFFTELANEILAVIPTEYAMESGMQVLEKALIIYKPTKA
jgi:hypothetical protein